MSDTPQEQEEKRGEAWTVATEEDRGRVRACLKEQLNPDHLTYIAEEWGEDARALTEEVTDATSRVLADAETLARSSPASSDTETETRVLKEAMHDIATRATYERNPDGDDQAALTMQLIAREALNWPESAALPETCRMEAGTCEQVSAALDEVYDWIKANCLWEQFQRDGYQAPASPTPSASREREGATARVLTEQDRQANLAAWKERLGNDTMTGFGGRGPAEYRWMAENPPPESENAVNALDRTIEREDQRQEDTDDYFLNATLTGLRMRVNAAKTERDRDWLQKQIDALTRTIKAAQND